MTTIYRTPPAHQNPVRQGNNSDHIYTIVIETGGGPVHSPRAGQTTRQLLLALETRHYGFSAGLPGGLSLGVNTGAERDTSAHALAIQGPDLLRQLASIALDDLGLEG